MTLQYISYFLFHIIYVLIILSVRESLFPSVYIGTKYKQCYSFLFFFQYPVKFNQAMTIFIFILISAPTEQLDLGFIMGATGSNGDEIFAAQQRLVQDILTSYTLSSKATLAGVILNGAQPTIPIKFGAAVTRDYFNRLVLGLDNPPFGSNLNGALQLARTSLFSEENGARANVPKTLVIFVNKKLASADVSSLGTEARALRAAGVKMVLIGVGDDVDKDAMRDFFDVWFFPDDLPALDRLVYPVVIASLPGKFSHIWR